MANTTVQGKVENWVRETWMPANLGQPFTKGRGRLSAGGEFEFDGISADGSTVACISTAKHKTSGGRNGMGKWFKLRSDMLYLVMAEDVGRRLLILTEPCMFEYYKAEQARGRVPRERSRYCWRSYPTSSASGWQPPASAPPRKSGRHRAEVVLSGPAARRIRPRAALSPASVAALARRPHRRRTASPRARGSSP